MSNLLVERLLVTATRGCFPCNYFEWLTAFFDNQPAEDRWEFVRRSKHMPNDEFERTMYWFLISCHVIAISRRCENCAYPSRLVVHHTTYEHRGLEHQNLQDLQVL